ncbi:MAG TPA: threonine aldolase family protein [Alphaproteobacteria bacterium]|nr:threonine aldolase family protein [Alphaproteobacteria bacterium]
MAPPRLIDLYSDTKTKPTSEMRRFMMAAEVGDEQKDEDPTVRRLREMVCERLGKEDAVFLPSGTMCNEIAIHVHCRPGEEVICDRTAHVITSEAGGPAALSGVMTNPIDGARGVYTAAQLRAAVRAESRYAPRSRLATVEQTSNLGGGTVWPLQTIREVAAAAREHNLKLHMDGARLFNAVVASGVAAADYAAPFDSVWIDFTKGLGAPVGAMLAGSRDFIAQAWRLKQQWGGAMRQAGIIAAAGIYALEHHVARLGEDHDNARRLAEGLAELPGIAIDPAAIETNIVFFRLRPESGWDAPSFAKAMRAQGVELGAFGPDLIRAVTHLDVSREDIDAALAAAAAVLGRERRARAG